MNIDIILNKYIDKSYKQFHEKICPTNYEILGIKIPALRKISKNLLKKYNYQEILNNLNCDYYEYIMLQGLVIANAKINYKEKLKLVNSFINKIENWAICDVFCSELKFVKENEDTFFYYVIPYLNCNKEFFQRFAIVILIYYYINDKYIDLILEKILEIKSEYYYVKMAISWCLSVCLIKYFDKTILFLKENKNNIDRFTYNKALQKGIESHRISKDNKKILQKMKIK